MEAVSIIMKVWNASAHTKLCLETLLENTASPFELIIVDNGSKPRLKDYLRRKALSDLSLRLIENSTNRGPGYANRQGLAVASHPLVCLIDSDVLVPPGWLERLVDEFRNHSTVKILSPVKPEENIRYPLEEKDQSSWEAWAAVKRQSRHLPPLEQYLAYSRGLAISEFDKLVCQANPWRLETIDSPPDFLSTCCALLEAGFALKAGGVADPAYCGYGSEDVDLCWRIGAAGGQVAKTTSVYVHHFQGSSLDDNGMDRAAALRTANQILYEKWKSPLLDLVSRKSTESGIDLVTYLESHFIFQALAQNTDFIYDLRNILQDPELPTDITWRPESSTRSG